MGDLGNIQAGLFQKLPGTVDAQPSDILRHAESGSFLKQMTDGGHTAAAVAGDVAGCDPAGIIFPDIHRSSAEKILFI